MKSKKYMIRQDEYGNYTAYYKPKYWPWYIQCYGFNVSNDIGAAERIAWKHAAGLPSGFVKYYEPKGEE